MTPNQKPPRDWKRLAFDTLLVLALLALIGALGLVMAALEMISEGTL